jgi:vitamin K-dependent gamma-carboxylase
MAQAIGRRAETVHAAGRAQAAAWITRWRDYLLAEVDGAALGVFRILFGLIMFWEVTRYFGYGWIARYYIDPAYNFSYLPFVQPWPAAGMYAHFAALGVLSILIALGVWYRAAAWLFFVGFTYVFLLDKAQYLNHFYLISLISLLMALAPADRALSLRRTWDKDRSAGMVPRWSMHMLRFQVAIVYFFGGIAKLNADWLSGYPLGDWLQSSLDLPILGTIVAQPWAGVLFAWGGLVVDLTVPFLLLFPRTFWLGALMVLGFNLLNARLFSIGIFPWFMLGALALFPRPDWPRLILGTPAARRRTAIQAKQTVGRSVLVLLIGLHVYAAVQLVLPFRHWLYPSDVAWSEEGHRFAWRMKLRDKDAQVTFYTTDPVSGEREAVRARQWISSRQEGKMASRPDMIHQFAHFVADDYAAAHGVRPLVTVDAFAGLNGRERTRFIDPTVDLAAEPIGLGARPWILPMP